MPTTTDVIEAIRLGWYRRATPTLFVLLLACGFVGAFVYKLRIDGIFACPASGYGSNAYLSDCTARTYGDYDHGAFWFGLEPQAHRAAADADVLLVGNSRLQFAFSGTATASWFSVPGIRHYLLGFSHSETVAFYGPLLAKVRPRARAYVINVDRLFDDRVSPPTEQIFQRRDILERYKEKRTWQLLHKQFCAALPVACGNSFAVYRTRETGVWQRRGGGRLETKQVSDGKPSNVDRWDKYASLGEKFLAQLPADRSCVILTIVPTVDTKRAEARAIAEKLGHDLLAPEIDDLRTFDGSHLDEESAARWSAAFLREAGPRIRRCVDAARASTG
ncbi:MAG TPA: hypothetical protein VJT81_12500 [Burkholderiales bacterium]|nr:hypothetical protein [Burkholderiales bacterium]